jgi:phage terminase large subunit
MTVIKRQVQITDVYVRTEASTKQFVVNVGGAGSSKSHSVAQLQIQNLFTEQNYKIAIGRKTFPALRMTAYKLVTDLLKDYGLYNLNNHNKTENIYHNPLKNSSIQFFSLDDPEKIKSADFNDIWLEEANEFTYEDYLVLKMRLRAPSAKMNKMYLTLNPIDENNWIATKLSNDPTVDLIRSTYHDNPFLTKDYIAILENLINEDLNYYRIYVLGEWGKLENIIFNNWQVVDEMPAEFEKQVYGLDFGFVNPSAFIHEGIIGKDLYIDELLYERNLTNSDLISRLISFPRLDIYADSAEPQRIEELKRAGLNCYPANKDVKLGIDTLKRYNLKITKRSINVIKEIRGYQRKKDKDGKVLEEPVKFNDHAIDATRYGAMGIVFYLPDQTEYRTFNTMSLVDIDI